MGGLLGGWDGSALTEGRWTTLDLVMLAWLAAEAADTETRDHPPPAGRARRAVRGLVEELRRDPDSRTLLDQVQADLPVWATSVLADQSVERFTHWSSARTRPEREDFLRQTYTLLITPDEVAAHGIVRAVCSEAAALSELSDLLADASERGLDQVLSEHRAFHAAAALLSQWLVTPTWPEDLEFLRAHPRLTGDRKARSVITSMPAALPAISVASAGSPPTALEVAYPLLTGASGGGGCAGPLGGTRCAPRGGRPRPVGGGRGPRPVTRRHR